MRWRGSKGLCLPGAFQESLHIGEILKAAAGALIPDQVNATEKVCDLAAELTLLAGGPGCSKLDAIYRHQMSIRMGATPI